MRKFGTMIVLVLALAFGALAQDKPKPEVKNPNVIETSAKEKENFKKLIEAVNSESPAEKDKVISEQRRQILDLQARLIILQMKVDNKCYDCEVDRDGNLVKPEPPEKPEKKSAKPAKD